MAKVQKLDILSFAKLQTYIFGCAGLIAGVLYAFGGLIIDALVTIGWVSGVYWGTPGLSYGTVLAMGAFPGMPIIFAVFGFAVGIVEAVIYNLFARLFGGVEIDFE